MAREFGIGWHIARAAVRAYGTPRVDDPTRLKGVEAIGLDETAFAATSATRSTSSRLVPHRLSSSETIPTSQSELFQEKGRCPRSNTP